MRIHNEMMVHTICNNINFIWVNSPINSSLFCRLTDSNNFIKTIELRNNFLLEMPQRKYYIKAMNRHNFF
ncbi:hypothetical protein D3C81_2086630 [compost metagenome]